MICYEADERGGGIEALPRIEAHGGDPGIAPAGGEDADGVDAEEEDEAEEEDGHGAGARGGEAGGYGGWGGVARATSQRNRLVSASLRCSLCIIDYIGVSSNQA